MNALAVAVFAVIATVLFLIVGRSFLGLQSGRDTREAGTEFMQEFIKDETADERCEGDMGLGEDSGQPSSPLDKGSRPAVSETTCPVRMPVDCARLEYREGRNVESWHGYTASDCRRVAREMLLGLEEDGFELVKAGFLDLSGNAWGCTAKTQHNSSLVISLIPERLGASNGKNNRLLITVVHMKALEAEHLDGVFEAGRLGGDPEEEQLVGNPEEEHMAGSPEEGQLKGGKP